MKKEPFRFTLFLLICLSLLMIGTAQAVDVPDPNLRAAIETELGKTSGDPITAEDMTTLIFLGISNANISDLTGLEGATNLTYLFLWNNSISDLTPLGGLTKLQFLDLQGNSVSDLWPVMVLTNLIFLGIRDNSVSELSPLVANTELGEKDAVNAKGNLLNYSSIYTRIPTLQRRGVEVRFDNRTPTTLAKISGDVQNDIVGVALPQSFIVEVQDENGEVFEGVPVVFSVTAGGGTVQPELATTDADGRAEGWLTLGSDPGTNTVKISVEGISPMVVFSAEANLRMPTTLSIVSGDNQTGMIDEALASPFVVEVRDQRNDPLEGVAVTFVVSVGGGMLSDISVDTDANGLAQSILTPGRERGTNTVEVSVEGIAERVTFNALAETLLFDLSLPSGVSLIHVPLEVMSVDGRERTIESVGDLYDALGGAATVNMLTTYDPDMQGWQSYLGDTSADKPLTDEMGIFANMSVPVSVRLGGDALGVNGSSTITMNQGANLVGLPLNDSRIIRVSDLFTLEGIANNVSAIVVSDGGTFKAIRQAGTDGDISVKGGQAFLMTASETTTVTISGDGWHNTSTGAMAAPLLATRGIQAVGTTPVLALSGLVIGQVQRINSAGLRVTVKNLSSDSAFATVVGDIGSTSSQVDYQLTVVDMERGQVAAIGDILEISIRSTDASIGVETLQYTVTAEDVRRSRVELPALVLQEIPSETVLLRNYPNPFNPETWIPYRLAQDAFVTLTIYDGSGRVVRTLDIGHQVAASYGSRSKAIYWDGRNEVGERVASGVYFYHLSAGDYSATRKMLILK